MSTAMGILAAAGTTCIGVVIGWLVRFAADKFKKFPPKALASVVAVIFGGVVVTFIGRLATETWLWWFYPIGLVVGMLTRRYNLIKNPGGWRGTRSE